LKVENDAAKGMEYLYFSPEFFMGIAGYNRLLMSLCFYEPFTDFSHLLICQLDTFVFKDELNQWCTSGYDYIGAPWRFDMSLFIKWPQLFPWSYRHPFLAPFKRLTGQDYLVGNGGFSLRNVEKARMILHDHADLVARFEDESRQNIQKNDGHGSMLNEDLFWALYVPKHIPSFRVPNYRRALQFAFEVDPIACYEDNGRQLPFGCHAWETHGLDFWRPFINTFGHAV
jgi:hypothetical protein